ncbi:MAG: hypothetical protein O2894_05655 [Planctomycetota bacterium]|nr:hypothetical protein [Planctomycetota bacterium]
MRLIERVCLYLVVAYAGVGLLDRARADDEAEPAQPASVIEATEVVLRNSDGDIVLRLGATTAGAGVVEVFNKTGQLATRLFARPDRDGELQLFDEHGELRANIGGNDVGGYINIYKSQDVPAIYLGADSDREAGYAVVYGAGGKPAVQLFEDDGGGRVAASRAGDGRRVIEMGAAPEGAGGFLALSNGAGNPGLACYCSDVGGQVKALNSDGNAAAFLGVSSDPAGNGLIYVARADGQRILETGANTSRGGYLGINSGDGKRTVFLGSSTGESAGDGVLEIMRKQGSLGVVLRAYEGGSSIRVYDKDEKVIQNLR